MTSNFATSIVLAATVFAAGCADAPGSGGGGSGGPNGSGGSAPQKSEAQALSDLDGFTSTAKSSPDLLAIFGVTNAQGGGALVYLFNDHRYVSAYYVGAPDASGANLYQYKLMASSGVYSSDGKNLHFDAAQYSTCPDVVAQSGKNNGLDATFDSQSMTYTVDASTVTLPAIAIPAQDAGTGQVLNWGCLDSAGGFTAQAWAVIP